MSAFGGLVLTNRGRILQSKAQAGTQLKYTRIALGDGNLGSSSILELNALRHEIKSLLITKLKTLGDGKAVVGTVLRPQDVTEGFYFRELGLFATDPDVGEILYCYGNAGSLAEYIPASGVDTIEKIIDLQTIIGNATNVTAILNSLIYETPEGSQEKANQAETNAKTYADTKFALAETPAGAQAKVNLAINNLVNSAPGALDTLQEIASALANDPNFATTILNRLTADEQDVANHKADAVKHITAAERTSWNGKVNSGSSNTDISEIKAILLETDTRDTIVTRDTEGKIIKIEEKSGANVVRTTTVNRTDGVISSIVEVANGKTITYTVIRVNGKISSVTKAVV